MEPNCNTCTKDKKRMSRLSPRQQQLVTDITRGLLVIISSIIYSLAVDIFLEPAQLLSVGATSVGQIITATLNKIMPGTHNFFTDNVGIYVFIVNIPLFIIGFKHVSPRFVIFSGLSVLVQTIFMQEWVGGRAILESIGINPETDKLFLAIIAGLFVGVAIGLALRYGTSTGGVDVVAQALALKKNISIGMFTMALNVLIAIIGGGLLQGVWVIALFTIIRMVLNSLVIDKIHTSYTYMGLHIFSNDAYDIA